MTTSVAILLAIQGCAILCLAVVSFALARQVGVLHQRLGPVGALALSKRVQVGEKSPEFRLDTLDGEVVVVGAPDPDGKSTLITFLTPNCPVCAQLLPARYAPSPGRSRVGFGSSSRVTASPNSMRSSEPRTGSTASRTCSRRNSA